MVSSLMSGKRSRVRSRSSSVMAARTASGRAAKEGASARADAYSGKKSRREVM